MNHWSDNSAWMNGYVAEGSTFNQYYTTDSQNAAAPNWNYCVPDVYYGESANYNEVTARTEPDGHCNQFSSQYNLPPEAGSSNFSVTANEFVPSARENPSWNVTRHPNPDNPRPPLEPDIQSIETTTYHSNSNLGHMWRSPVDSGSKTKFKKPGRGAKWITGNSNNSSGKVGEHQKLLAETAAFLGGTYSVNREDESHLTSDTSEISSASKMGHHADRNSYPKFSGTNFGRSNTASSSGRRPFENSYNYTKPQKKSWKSASNVDECQRGRMNNGRQYDNSFKNQQFINSSSRGYAHNDQILRSRKFYDNTNIPQNHGWQGVEDVHTNGLPAYRDFRGKKSYDNRSNNLKRPEDIRSNRTSPKKESVIDSEASQRERLIEQLSRGTLECLVCCEPVKQKDSVWSCSSCYHVLHLLCIQKWAKSSRADSGWRCPACQNVSKKLPWEYQCFCGQQRDPIWNPHDIPHSCGELCSRTGSNRKGLADSIQILPSDCNHRCTLLCHPGPCPLCSAQVTRVCGCGKLTKVVTCGSVLLCGETCAKTLNCGKHTCEQLCHTGPCEECSQMTKQECYCRKESREVSCTKENLASPFYCCENICGHPLDCGNHFCEEQCHQGDCKPCDLKPDVVKCCPCGKTLLSDIKIEVSLSSLALDEKAATDPCEKSKQMEVTNPHLTNKETGINENKSLAFRTSCLDPIPVCSEVCGKILKCGQPGNHHKCGFKCHTGSCPTCPLTTSVKCRCGSLDKDFPCSELTTRADDARCQKRCSKKRSCGKHKCGQVCCIELEHVCPLICNHMLSCGNHRCEELCHRGNCKPCLQSSFEELPCECGAYVIMPPVPCGTRRPKCNNPCSRQHSCEHPALHSCHSELTCPPCTVLVQRWCYGHHELRKAVPCHQTEVSCGLPCGKDLECCRHKCIALCHRGECNQQCSQPCTKPRSLCGHPCAAPCHEGQCPDTPCKEMVKVTCECGHRSTLRTCCENANEYKRIATSLLAAKMSDMQAGKMVDLTDLHGSRKISLKTLECNDECRLVERNRRLAIGLQIRNPDLSAKLTPRYSDFMRQWAKKDAHFCAMVHNKLTELVQLSKQSKQKSRSYSFESMNRDKRHFIHECCEHFGCESVAYDQEPNRNVVATAARDKAWLPSMSLLEVIQRENGQRKIPKPVITAGRTPTLRAMEVLPSLNSQSTGRLTNVPSSTPPGELIDYFDYS